MSWPVTAAAIEPGRAQSSSRERMCTHSSAVF
jgi:hypothetical protein